MAEVGAGGVGEAADGLVAEDRFQELLAEDGGAARDADLDAGQAACGGEDGQHDQQAHAVDAERGRPGHAALVGALLADEFQHVPLPVADRLGGAWGRFGGDPAELSSGFDSGTFQQVTPLRCESHASTARSAEPSAVARISDSTPLSRATLSRLSGAGRPVKAATIWSRSQPTRVSRERMRSPVPMKSCQRARTSPRRSVPSRMASSKSAHADVVALLHQAAQQLVDAEHLPVGGLGQGRHPDRQAVERAAQGAPDHVGAGLVVGGQAVEPLLDRADRDLGQPAPVRWAAEFRTSNSGVPPRPFSLSSRRRSAATGTRASSGTRWRITAMAVLRSLAMRRNPQGTSSA